MVRGPGRLRIVRLHLAQPVLLTSQESLALKRALRFGEHPNNHPKAALEHQEHRPGMPPTMSAWGLGGDDGAIAVAIISTEPLGAWAGSLLKRPR